MKLKLLTIFICYFTQSINAVTFLLNHTSSFLDDPNSDEKTKELFKNKMDAMLKTIESVDALTKDDNTKVAKNTRTLKLKDGNQGKEEVTVVDIKKEDSLSDPNLRDEIENLLADENLQRFVDIVKKKP